jgi:CopG-like RHH_1 or ribbon-helix-helix domain, RHH_5
MGCQTTLRRMTTQKKRINLYFAEEGDEILYEAVASLAVKEKRSLSQIAKFLIAEAIEARKSKEQT